MFVRNDDGGLCFRPAAPPTDADVQRVVARVRRRLDRLGLISASDADGDVDPLAEESGALAGLAPAAVLNRAALGGRAGRGPVRIGAYPDAPWVDRHMPLHAHDAGFDLHAAVHVAAGDRKQLARLCRYLCRPPLGQHRLERLRDGRIALALLGSYALGVPQRRERVFLVASLDGDPRAVLFADDAGAPEPAPPSRDLAFAFYWTEGTRGLGSAVDCVPTLKGGSTIGIPSPPAILLPTGEVVTPQIRI